MNSKNIILAVGLFILSFSAFSQDGAATFKQSCAACHSIGKGRLVGPDLKGVTDRRKEAWLLKWIKSSQSLIDAGDKAAQELFTQFNEVPMPDQDFSDADIKSILTYIKNESGGVATTAPTNTSSTESTTAASPTQTSTSSDASSSASTTVAPAPSTTAPTSVENTSNTVAPSNNTEAVKESGVNSTSFTTYLLFGVAILLVVIISVMAGIIKTLSTELASKSEK